MFPRDEQLLQTGPLDEPVEYLTAYNIQGAAHSLIYLALL